MSFSPRISINFKNIKVSIKILSILQLVWNRIETGLEKEEIFIIGCLMLWCCFQCELNSRESSHVLCTGIAKDDLILFSVWHQNKHLIIWNNFQSLVTQYPFKHDSNVASLKLLYKSTVGFLKVNLSDSQINFKPPLFIICLYNFSSLIKPISAEHLILSFPLVKGLQVPGSLNGTNCDRTL